MERLSLKEVRSLLGFIRGLYAADSVPHFVRYVSSEIPKIISSYNEADSLSVKVIGAGDSGEMPFPEPATKSHAVLNYHPRNRDSRPGKISDFSPRNKNDRLGLDNRFHRHVAAGYQLTVTLRTASAGSIGSIVLTRSRRDFSERERLMVNIIRPHLLQAYQNLKATTRTARELTDARNSMEAASVGAIVLSGRRVRFMTAHAEQMLRRYFSPVGHVDGIPESLQRWTEQQMALANRKDDPEPGKPFVVEREGRHLIVRLRAEPDQTLLMLHEHSTKPQLEDLRPLGLSHREAEVLFWVAHGKTNAETGSILIASTRTVGKHLEKIYQKLGVETRTAAAMIALTFFT